MSAHAKRLHQYRRLQDWEQQVECLLDLKKAHLRASKKQQAQATKAVKIWKKRTWKPLSRTSSKVDTTVPTPPDDEDADDEDEQVEEEELDEKDSLTQAERSDSMQEVSNTLTKIFVV